ncbi:MAG TPA: membrane protein insertion efficiency factor YidD [bacterium]|nr:membrane protein insertion efficiency factor YidD [bacterium]
MSLKELSIVLLKKLDKAISSIMVVLIKIYKVSLSPLFGNNCRFYPTCSEYGVQALKKYGSMTGSWLLLKRLLRCSPLNDGGYDPLI